jgi:hypothetical protein
MQSLNWGLPFSVTLLLSSCPRFCSPLVSHTQPKLKRPSAWTATSSVLGAVLLAGSKKLTCSQRQQLLSEILICGHVRWRLHKVKHAMHGDARR